MKILFKIILVVFKDTIADFHACCSMWIYACVLIVRKIPIHQVVVYVRGEPLEKCGGGGVEIKIEQGKQKEKKNRAPKSLKKKFVQRILNKENYKLK